MENKEIEKIDVDMLLSDFDIERHAADYEEEPETKKGIEKMKNKRLSFNYVYNKTIEDKDGKKGFNKYYSHLLEYNNEYDNKAFLLNNFINKVYTDKEHINNINGSLKEIIKIQANARYLLNDVFSGNITFKDLCRKIFFQIHEEEYKKN